MSDDAESFDLPDVDHFVTGAVGPPGQRVFYLQAALGAEVVTLKLEKQQVAALCEHLGAMMADLPELASDPSSPPGTSRLREPVEAAWAVGSLGVAYEHDDDRIVIVAEELVATGPGPDDPDDDWAFSDITVGATARLRVPRRLVGAFVTEGLAATAAGRPTCDFCGRPMDPGGHPCPRLN